MKKLLSLLSVLTISGTTMPTVIANAPNNKANNVLATAPDYCTTVPNINNIDTTGSIFEVQYCFLCADKIYATFNSDFAKYAICNFIFAKDKEQYKNTTIVALLEKAKQINNTGAGGSILQSDYKVVGAIIWDWITYFQEKYDLTQTVKSDLGKRVRVYTNRNGDLGDHIRENIFLIDVNCIMKCSSLFDIIITSIN